MSNSSTKTFDAVAMMRAIRDELSARRCPLTKKIVGCAPRRCPIRRCAASWIWPLGSGVLMKPLKKIPPFKDEDAEREFWATADSTEYIDWSEAQRLTLPKFRPALSRGRAALK
jgi:hypothetical protein